jgi:hypothetical protein
VQKVRLGMAALSKFIIFLAMPTSTNISLPSNQKPRFPEKCIVCEAVPNSTIKIARTSQNSLLTLVLPILILFGWSRVEAPICQRCKPRFRFQHWGRDLLCLIVVLALASWLWPMFKDWSSLNRKLAMLGLFLLAFAPFVLAETYWPRRFDATMNKYRIEYEFAFASYANEFRELNSGADQK